MRKILLFITLHLALLAGAQETPASTTDTNRKPGQIVVRDREDRKPLASASLVFNQCYQIINRVADEDGRVDTKGMTPDRMPVEVSCVGY